MKTRVHGNSDDLIEFHGDIHGEVGCYGTDDEDHSGVFLAFSDGTFLSFKYCGKFGGVWSAKVIREGSLLEKVELCDDADAVPYSDVVVFRSGLKYAFYAAEYGQVR